MHNRKFWIGMSLWLLFSVNPAAAVTLRYAVVIGNNQGMDEGGERPFSRLTHAEIEAEELRDRLIQFSNFDPNRIELILGASRDEVRNAMERIGKLRSRDLAEIGQADTLFAFFYTGHGIKGQLLLQDGPLGADELGKLIQDVGATFNLGFFDACFSGSLDEAALSQKGVEITPGLNLFRELPEEVLTAAGSVWFVSSGPTQMSYEDEKIGGVFTHFLIQALEKGPREGPGITLDRIWSYVRNETLAYTTARGRRQVPQQFVARLKSTGPLYFSFPVERSSTLLLSASVEGRFVLSYAEGQLTEVIEKGNGQALRLAVFPGSAHLMAVSGGTVTGQKALSFEAGRTTVVRTLTDQETENAIGTDRQTLWEKGFGDQMLSASIERLSWDVFAGLRYAMQYTDRGTLLPRYLPEFALRLDRGHFILGASLGYGYLKEKFEAFSYHADALSTSVWGGWGVGLGKTRLSGTLGLRGGVVFQRFDDGAKRQRYLIQPEAAVAWLFPIAFGTLGEVSGQIGTAYLPGVGKETTYVWKLHGGFSLCLYYRF